jgi:hypothetical protein
MMKRYIPDVIAWGIGIALGVILTSPEHRWPPVIAVTVVSAINMFRRVAGKGSSG